MKITVKKVIRKSLFSDLFDSKMMIHILELFLVLQNIIGNDHGILLNIQYLLTFTEFNNLLGIIVSFHRAE